MIQIKHSNQLSDNLILVINKDKFKANSNLNKTQNKTIQDGIKAKQSLCTFYDGSKHIFAILESDNSDWQIAEKLRKQGASIANVLNEYKQSSVSIVSDVASHQLALAEGIALANYQFLKYFTKAKELANSLKEINLTHKSLSGKHIASLNISLEATYIARDLVNEPQSYLTAKQLSAEFKKLGTRAGFTVDVWNKAKIEAQKMGGILAVNKGSVNEPTFNIMTYKPKNAINKKPYVLVGKGVVYDTGGLSLKPTPNSMDYMKCDMAGSAVVAGTLYAVAKNKLPLYVIGLVPATDNWLGENSYAPGDVITMYSGTTVEVMNTDAEGRLILADALHYAKKLNPELVCDFATLTGAAVRALGTYATATLGTASDETKQAIFNSSYAVFERLVEFPLWDDYANELKSSIADMTNLGKGEGGQISAAKFLQHFVDYPWMHFDIAGPAFNHAPDAYKPKGGTGVGVRLMLSFLTQMTEK